MIRINRFNDLDREDIENIFADITDIGFNIQEVFLDKNKITIDMNISLTPKFDDMRYFLSILGTNKYKNKNYLKDILKIRGLGYFIGQNIEYMEQIEDRMNDCGWKFDKSYFRADSNYKAILTIEFKKN